METFERETVVTATPASTLSDAEIVDRVRRGERALFEVLMRRHNQRLYRVARAVLKDEGEVEDVMQQAYINAYLHLHQFEERSQFSTWLTRIALNEAFRRRRRKQAADVMTDGHDPAAFIETVLSPQPDPERQAYAHELQRVLEDAVDALPDTYRVVFVLREIEGLSTSEAGEGLGIGEEAVKTRLHRARAMIRRRVTEKIGDVVPGALLFHASRCDRVVAAVLATIADAPPH